MAVWTLFPFLSLAVSLVSGSPAARFPLETLKARQSITTLTTSQIDAFEPYAWYSNTGYCPASETINWSCGGVCLSFYFMLEIILLLQSIARQIQPSSHSHLAAMVTVYNFGLLALIQHWRPSLSRTKGPIPKKCMLQLAFDYQHSHLFPRTQSESLLTDADFFLESIDSSLFTGVSSSVEVDSGFASDQAACVELSSLTSSFSYLTLQHRYGHPGRCSSSHGSAFNHIYHNHGALVRSNLFLPLMGRS